MGEKRREALGTGGKISNVRFGPELMGTCTI